uniref:NADH-ubiquinone oxidoreductase chain 2 n=1 Tax=Phycomyces blakesleeanus TaxID=4837 RepID=A0A0K1HPI5_PHYBL|nr:NADH dehydrogenase subunit 2 [Phycomyces blakesleeanus]AKT93742.1 NADH dehydrogenase subunit 2 [Phycomyces blakesleeanus]
MVLFSVLTMILAIALFSLRIPAIYFNRITIIILLYSALLSYNTLYTDLVSSGVGLFGGLFQVTAITQSIDVFIYLLGALVLLLGENSTLVSKGKKLSVLAEYPLIALLSVLGMSSLISSSDLVSMFLSIELQSFAVYILATIYRESESATAAGLKYFLLGSLSSALILLGSSLLYGFTGLTSFEGLYMLCSTTTTNHAAIEISVLLMVVGLLFKVSAAPFHNWAPDVYDGVPTVVTTWLTTMPKISFLVFILEFQGFTQLGNWSSWTYLLLISSLLSLVVGTVGGLAQYRIKRLLTFSTISHVGFLLLALAINSEESVESFLFYLIQYSLTNVNVFFILIAFGYLLQTKGLSPYSPIQYINQLKGQFQANPLLGLSLAICLFSMAGIPPLVGFFGKQMVLYAATHNGNFFLALVAVVVSVVSAAYYLRVIKVIHFDPLNVTETVETNNGSSNNIGGSVSGVLTTSSSLVIATITLLLIFFILNPSPLLNSVHLLTLNLFYW